MKLLTVKELMGFLNVSKMALSYELRKIPFELKKVEGVKQKVKHYKYSDLPERYRLDLKEKEEFNEEEYLEEKPQKKVPELNGFLRASLAKQKEAKLKMKVVVAYENRHKDTTIKDFIKHLHYDFDELEVTKHKIHRWVKQVREARIAGTSPLEALLDSRGQKDGSTKLSEEMQLMALRYFLNRKNPLRPQAIYENMLYHYGVLMPSFSSLTRFINKWLEDNYNKLLYTYATNPDKFKNSNMSAQGSASEKAKFRNHFWELDSTPADIICSDGKRWAIMAVIDIYSRRVVFHLDERSSSYSIARLLRKAMLILGIPRVVVIDNGKDYTSNHFEDICLNFDIQQYTVAPYSGDKKPHIERIFRTLSSGLFEQLDGYIGHSVADREAIQNRKGFKGKLEAIDRHNAKAKNKKEFANLFTLNKDNLGVDINLAMSSKELAEWIDKWNKAIYEQRTHGSLKMSPIKKWQSDVMPVESIEDIAMLDVLLGKTYKRKILKEGITIDGIWYNNIDTFPHHTGESVLCMATDDLGYVRVYTEKYEPLCTAIAYEFLGKSREELKRAKQLSHKLMREFEKRLDEIDRLNISDPSIKDRITAKLEDLKGDVKALANPTTAVAKTTEIIKKVKESEKVFEEQTKEDKKLVKEDGTPIFKNFKDKALWLLERGEFDKANRIKDKYPESYRIAYEEFKKTS